MYQRPLERYTSIENTYVHSYSDLHLIYVYDFNRLISMILQKLTYVRHCVTMTMSGDAAFLLWPSPSPPPQTALSISTYWVRWLPFHAGDLNAHAFMDLWMHSLQPWSHQFFSVNNKWRRQHWNCDFSDFISLTFNFCVVIGLDNSLTDFILLVIFRLSLMIRGRIFAVGQNF